MKRVLSGEAPAELPSLLTEYFNLTPGVDSRTLWQMDTLWQPLREVVEKLLITYDWAESFVGLNLVLKPLVDELFMKHLSGAASSG